MSNFKPYTSHKKVEAARIALVEPNPNGDGTFQVTVDGGRETVPGDTFTRYMPVPGDFLVRYSDGYLSVSPAAAFAEGYTADLV